jgi:metal-responsive CopG/Arc/MetJ family transcriptional regulator
MVRQQRSGERPEQVSLRLPKHLATKVDDFKEKDGTDRSVIILRALRYWLEVEGNVTTDNEFLNRLSHIETDLSDLKKNADLFEKERQNYQEVILKQQNTIETLLGLIKEWG